MQFSISIVRSNKNIQALVIDSKGLTVVSFSSASLKKGTKTEKSLMIGEKVAKYLQEKHPDSKIVFNRKGYRYHGRVKALAESLRENGLKI